MIYFHYFAAVIHRGCSCQANAFIWTRMNHIPGNAFNSKLHTHFHDCFLVNFQSLEMHSLKGIN